jgi:hypothetical protein
LKAILQELLSKYSRANANGSNEGDNADVHPLLQKISEERWFPRGRIPLTLDAVIDAIVKKLPEAMKTMRKVFLSHLDQIQQYAMPSASEITVCLFLAEPLVTPRNNSIVSPMESFRF